MDLTNQVFSEKYEGLDKDFLEFPKNPIHYSKSASADPFEPPLLGEHTDSILKNLLGYSDTRI